MPGVKLVIVGEARPCCALAFTGVVTLLRPRRCCCFSIVAAISVDAENKWSNPRLQKLSVDTITRLEEVNGKNSGEGG